MFLLSLILIMDETFIVANILQGEKEMIRTLHSPKRCAINLIFVFVFYALFLFSRTINVLSECKNPIPNRTIQILISGAFAVLSYWMMGSTTKILIDKLKIDRKTNIYLGMFGVLLAFLLLCVLHVARNVYNVFQMENNLMIEAFIVACAAGIFEEFLVRGLAFSACVQLFKEKCYCFLMSAVGTSLLFGLMHLSNLSFQSITATLQQVFYTFALGLCFSVIRIQRNGLSLAFLLHALIDFQPSISNNSGLEAAPWGLLLTIFIPVIIVSVFCLIQQDKHLNNTKLKSDYYQTVN